MRAVAWAVIAAEVASVGDGYATWGKMTENIHSNITLKNLKSIVGASQKGWAGAVGSGRERWAVWTLQFLLFFFLKNGHSRES